MNIFTKNYSPCSPAMAATQNRRMKASPMVRVRQPVGRQRHCLSLLTMLTRTILHRNKTPHYYMKTVYYLLEDNTGNEELGCPSPHDSLYKGFNKIRLPSITPFRVYYYNTNNVHMLMVKRVSE